MHLISKEVTMFQRNGKTKVSLVLACMCWCLVSNGNMNHEIDLEYGDV